MRLSLATSLAFTCGALALAAACGNFPAVAASGGGAGSGGDGGSAGSGGGSAGSGGGFAGSGGGSAGSGGFAGGGGGSAGSGGGSAGSGGGAPGCAPADGDYGDCEMVIGWGFRPESGRCEPISGCGCEGACPELFPDSLSCQVACDVVAGCEDVTRWPWSGCGGAGDPAPPPPGGGGAWAQAWGWNGQSCVELPACGCDPARDPCEAVYYSYEECMGSCDAPLPPDACGARLSQDACAADRACQWLYPGCGEPSIPAEGCYQAVPCFSDADCAPGLHCQEQWYDPCVIDPCNACGAPINLCVEPVVGDCGGAYRDASGSCWHPEGTPADPACCAPYSCDQSQVTCRVMTPTCAPGEVPSVNPDGCWGPCVRAELCADDQQRLCESTAGRWVMQSCGHYSCGFPPACAALIPGCDCGFSGNFVAGVGCVEDRQCMLGGGTAQLGEPCGGMPGPDGSITCATGLYCNMPPDLPDDAPGTCELDPGYACSDAAPCPGGSACCYPCGIAGCEFQCMVVDPDGGCPMFP